MQRLSHGFTLIEAMVVVAVLAILVGVAAPSFQNLIITSRVKNASFDLFSSLVFARSEAITRNTTDGVTVAPATGGWTKGWTVKVKDSSGTVLVLKTQNEIPNITISGPGTVTYNSMGRLTATVTPFSMTATGARSSDGRCIRIDLSGRPVVKPGTCPS